MGSVRVEEWGTAGCFQQCGGRRQEGQGVVNTQWAGFWENGAQPPGPAAGE